MSVFTAFLSRSLFFFKHFSLHLEQDRSQLFIFRLLTIFNTVYVNLHVLSEVALLDEK